MPNKTRPPAGASRPPRVPQAGPPAPPPGRTTGFDLRTLQPGKARFRGQPPRGGPPRTMPRKVPGR